MALVDQQGRSAYGIKQGGSEFYGNRHTENNLETPNNSETLKTQEE